MWFHIYYLLYGQNFYTKLNKHMNITCFIIIQVIKKKALLFLWGGIIRLLLLYLFDDFFFHVRVNLTRKSLCNKIHSNIKNRFVSKQLLRFVRFTTLKMKSQIHSLQNVALVVFTPKIKRKNIKRNKYACFIFTITF